MIKSQLIWNGAARDAFRLAFPIEKTEKMEDGRLAVYGVATSEALDCDGEVIDYEAAKAAFSAWPGNIREQHDPKKAVGRALEVTADDDARKISVKAVISAGAPDTQAKILDGTLQCFSIGGKVAKRAPEPVTKADGSVVTAQRVFVKSITETSVVDVGANPDSGIAIVKAVGEDLVWAEGGEGGADSEGGEADAAKAQVRKYAGEEISDAATAIQALQSVFYLLYKEQQEPGEPPEQIAALKAVVENLKRFIASEIGETNSETITLAAHQAELEKAGKRFSAATKAALKAAHDSVRACDKALADLGYDADEDEGTDGEGGREEDPKPKDGEDKSAGASDDLQKAADAQRAAVEEIAKAAGLELAEPTQDALTKAALTELLALRKTHAELLASPAAPKGVAKAVVVGKEADGGGAEPKEPAPVVKSDGAVDDVATLVKAAQARPIRFA